MTASLIFAGQMVNFALPPLPVSGHLLGALAAALLGPWAGFIAISLVLFIQLALALRRRLDGAGSEHR